MSKYLSINYYIRNLSKNVSKNDMLKLPKPPRTPNISECCGDGCKYCVWVTYFDQQKIYQQKLKAYEYDSRRRFFLSIEIPR